MDKCKKKMDTCKTHPRAHLTALSLALFLCAPPVAAQTQQFRVSAPNVTASADITDLSVQTPLGPLAWKRTHNGTGWRFNRHWDGISASYKPIMTQNTGGGSPVSAGVGSAPAICWIWVDED
ncbi:MAG: hypothetical protein FWF12_08175, partial [Betaproteobacteria bacterium]|nr:hypothetical protein [Betaproteobacteria bacterium]